MLQVTNLRVDVGGVTLIDGVSFTVRAGEKVGLVGRNGAGKTSMLKVINGFYTPQKGRITFRGETRSKMRPYDAASGGIARSTFTFSSRKCSADIDTGGSIATSASSCIKWLWIMSRSAPAPS